MTAWMPPCFYDVHTTEYRVGKKYQIIVKINNEMIHVQFQYRCVYIYYTFNSVENYL